MLSKLLKFWLVFNLAIFLTMGAVQTAYTPLRQAWGPFNWATQYSMVRISITNTRTFAESVRYWQEEGVNEFCTWCWRDYEVPF